MCCVPSDQNPHMWRGCMTENLNLACIHCIVNTSRHHHVRIGTVVIPFITLRDLTVIFTLTCRYWQCCTGPVMMSLCLRLAPTTLQLPPVFQRSIVLESIHKQIRYNVSCFCTPVWWCSTTNSRQNFKQTWWCTKELLLHYTDHNLFCGNYYERV